MDWRTALGFSGAVGAGEDGTGRKVLIFAYYDTVEIENELSEMAFFKLDGQLVNLDYVRSVLTCCSDHASLNGVRLVFAGGEVSGVFKHRGDPDDLVGEIQRAAGPVWPAQPGFTLLGVNFYEPAEPSAELVLKSAARFAVVGWRLGEFGLEPISAVGDLSFDETALIDPAGVVVGAPPFGEADWPNIEAWAEDMCARWIKRRDKAA
jgi:hypothetical protein